MTIERLRDQFRLLCAVLLRQGQPFGDQALALSFSPPCDIECLLRVPRRTIFAKFMQVAR